MPSRLGQCVTGAPKHHRTRNTLGALPPAACSSPIDEERAVTGRKTGFFAVGCQLQPNALLLGKIAVQYPPPELPNCVPHFFAVDQGWNGEDNGRLRGEVERHPKHGQGPRLVRGILSQTLSSPAD